VKTVSIRRSLLTNILLVIVLLSAAIIATSFLNAREMVKTLSESLIGKTLDQVEVRLTYFFQSVMHELLLANAWGKNELLDLDDLKTLNHMFIPLIKQHPQISSLLFADDSGHEYMLLRINDQWFNRQTHLGLWGNRTLWWEWDAALTKPSLTWKTLDYDPRQRLWYQGAQQKYQTLSARSDVADAQEYIHWTEPYPFFTTQELGMTASIMFQSEQGRRFVIGFDILLQDISDFTSKLKVSDNGIAVVLTEDRRVISLPYMEALTTPALRKDALLKQPHELGTSLAENAVEAFDSRTSPVGEPLHFINESDTWWGQARSYSLSREQALLIVVLLPESDLLGSIYQRRVWVMLFVLAVLILAIMRAYELASRYSRPIEALVQQSDRISRLDLVATTKIESSVKEVRRLAQAQERMRHNLRSLLKLERDLQLAKQIQQSTIPDQLPDIKGYSLYGWSEPAEETGGDIYDVIAYQSSVSPQERLTTTTEVDAAVFLLADATGHGIGPALSVSQVRAMLRMAVRAGLDMQLITKHMNEQLWVDLHAGRFITAWLAELNVSTHMLKSFSAGQAPLFHFVFAQQMINRLEANTPPLGVIENIDNQAITLLALAPGDIFIVISDGVFDATNWQKEKYGIDRATAVIEQNYHRPADDLVAVLRASLNEFTDGFPAADDRTVVVIKRTAG